MCEVKSMKKKIVIKLKTDYSKLRNELHFVTQLTSRAHVFKSKKGKRSYTRKIKHKDEE